VGLLPRTLKYNIIILLNVAGLCFVLVANR
jgi:hypothetical protein